MRYKFVIVADVTMLIEDDVDESLHDQLYINEDEAVLKVVYGHHPKFNDNVIQLDGTYGVQLFKDLNGMLYHFSDYMTKEDAIKIFE